MATPLDHSLTLREGRELERISEKLGFTKGAARMLLRRALAALKKEGKLRWIGVSNFAVSQMARARAIADITSLQPPDSLIRRDIETDILPYCARHGIGVIVYAPMASGLLTGAMTAERAANLPEDDWRKRSPEFNEPKLSRNLALVERLRAVARRFGRTPGEVAIAWTLRNPAVTGAIVGARSAEQAEGDMRASELQLSAVSSRGSVRRCHRGRDTGHCGTAARGQYCASSYCTDGPFR